MPDRTAAAATTANEPPPPSLPPLRHELRTTVGQVIGYSEMLIEEATEGGYDHLVPDLERIRHAGRKTLDLIEAHLGSGTVGDSAAVAVIGEDATPPARHFGRAEDAPPTTAAALSPTEVHEVPGRILIVDDNEDNRALLARRLGALGYRCAAVGDGETALRRLGEDGGVFDVVLLDLIMPGIDGVETLRRIKGDPALLHLPVLMISAKEDTDTVVRCIEAGAADYLTKPFDPVLLRARVGSCLRAKRLRDREEQLLSEVQASLQRERRIADALQRSLVREVAPDAFPGLTVASLYEAAWSEAQVGGDLFDAFRLPSGKIALAVADASGKGLDAASRVTQVKYALRAYARQSEDDPAAVAAHLNDFLCDADANTDPLEIGGASFVTLALAVLDSKTGEACVLCAGSEPPMILRAATGETETVALNGMPLGVVSEVMYDVADCRLAPGDVLLLYSDGITEARRGSALLGTEGLARLAAEARAGWSDPDLSRLGTAILEGARSFGNGTLRDDACLLLGRRSAA